MTRSCLAHCAAVLAALGLLVQPALGGKKDVPYIDLTDNFSRFVDATTGMDDAARIKAFQTQMDALLPGFYIPRFGTTPEKYDAQISRALQGFATIRPQYEQLQRDFPPRSRPASSTSAGTSPASLRMCLSIYCTHSARWTAARAKSAARPT